MDPKHYSKYDRDTTKWKSKNRGQLTPLSNSAHLLPEQSHSNSNSNKLIIDKSCSLLQNRQKTNISIHKNVKKPHQGKSANDFSEQPACRSPADPRTGKKPADTAAR